MKLKQSGFTVLEIVLVIIVIAALGFAGWTYYQSNSKTAETSSSGENPQNEQTNTQPGDTSEETNSENEMYENDLFRLEMPSGWSFANKENDLSEGNVTYTFENDSLYFDVHLTAYGREVTSDLSWQYAPMQDGNKTKLEPTSTPTEICAEDGPFCSAGDGELSIFMKAGPGAEQNETVAFTSTVDGEARKTSLSLFAGNNAQETVKTPEIEQFKFLVNHITFKNQ